MNSDLEVIKNFDLTNSNTLAVKSIASTCVKVHSTPALQKYLHDYSGREKIVVLGEGSNVVLNNIVSATLIMPKMKGINVLSETDSAVLVEVAAGENWHDFVCYSTNNGWQGVENLSLIPGSVGAAPVQNIGAYGVELKDVFHSLVAVSLASGELREFDYSACCFSYRESVFKNKEKDQWVIVSVTFKLSKITAGASPEYNLSYGELKSHFEGMDILDVTLKEISSAVCSVRQRKLPDPKLIPNAGSFFKNPIVDSKQHAALKVCHPDLVSYSLSDGSHKLAAGWLIDQAGWKGFIDGGIGVHENQALVLISYRGASGGDVLRLAEKIKADVKQRYGVFLEQEPRVL